VKKIALAALWLLATAAAIAVASAGVGIVSDEVIQPAPDLITASVISEPPTQSIPVPPSTTSEAPETAPTSAPPTTEAPELPESPTTTTAPPVTVITVLPGPTTPTTPTPTTVTSTTTVVPPTTTAAPPTTTTTEAPSSILTFQLEGGTTAISFSATSVTVVWATPNQDFEVDIEPENDGVKVEFHSDTHRSAIEAWWDGGPQQDITEEPEND
jgi:hypothetical protein